MRAYLCVVYVDVAIYVYILQIQCIYIIRCYLKINDFVCFYLDGAFKMCYDEVVEVVVNEKMIFDL